MRIFYCLPPLAIKMENVIHLFGLSSPFFFFSFFFFLRKRFLIFHPSDYFTSRMCTISYFINWKIMGIVIIAMMPLYTFFTQKEKNRSVTHSLSGSFICTRLWCKYLMEQILWKSVGLPPKATTSILQFFRRAFHNLCSALL